MQVVMNKCFFLNPEKIWRKSVLTLRKKTQKPHTLIPKNDVTDPKARRPGYSNNQFKSC